jgi:hypothetical protein
MENKINSIEIALENLRKQPINNKQAISDICNKIIFIASDIKSENINKNHRKDIFFKNGFTSLSSTTMLVKKMPDVDMLEGNHLEQFSKDRETELRRVDLFNIHNQFWEANNVESGNVFASIPLALVPKNSQRILDIYGWQKYETIFYTISKSIDFRELETLCYSIFDYYLITKTKENKYIVLEYLISKL